MQAALLPDRGIIEISGADARRFLHGLLTADIERMTEATPRYAALLTPQGKIVADLLVVQSAEAEGACFLLDCERSLVAMLVAKLNFYKLRAKVTVEDVSNTTAVLALWDEAPASAAREPGSPWFADPRLAALGWRAVVSPATVADAVRTQGAALGDASAYEAHRIALGVPRGGVDFAYGDAFPHEACLDLLHGVSFKKGCFVGQEVVSRMQHRGTARTRVLAASAEQPLPSGGADVLAGGVAVGRLGSVAGRQGIALGRVDRVKEALKKGQTFTAGGVAIELAAPAWASYSLDPEPAGAAH